MSSPAAAPAARLLALENLQVAYGGIRAVKGIDIEVNEGELVCLIGANGAGKTTTLKAITGLVRPAGGQVRYGGEVISGLRVHEIARRGLALVPEGRGVFAQLTIEENLAMGAYSRKDAGGVAADTERAYTLFPRLKERRTQVAGTLSGGEQQMLAIARALMGRPRLLLLDEPSMGLAPLMVERIFEVIRTIAAEGVTLLLVEQNARLALEVSHRAYVLEGGTVALSGEASALLGNPRIREAYLGE
jgi:branched-chain amino acid transport system ATP-binding protein